MADINRLAWMMMFFIGVILFGWLEWQYQTGSGMVWFMLTSLWSAICAIGYTVLNWFLVDNK